MTDALMIDPRLGDAVAEAILNMTGSECHVIIIACPIVKIDDEHEGVGSPSFVTSLQPDDMEELIIQIAGGMAVAGKRIITGEYGAVTIQFSYSSIKTYDQCPKKYYHTRIKRDVEDVSGEAADYGTAVHTAAEEFTRDGTPMPKKFAYMAPIMEQVAKIGGTQYAELQLGVRKRIDGRFAPCAFDSPLRWWRGIIDFLAIGGHTAHMLDYKTGKSARYADPKQLDLMAGAIFVHFPEVMKIKSALAFVVAGDFVKKEHVRTEMSEYLSVFDPQLRDLATSLDKNVWNPKPSGLCGWCPVEDCAHWFERRR